MPIITLETISEIDVNATSTYVTALTIVLSILNIILIISEYAI